MSKNVVPCGGFELSDMLNVDKNGKLGISEGTPYQQLVTDGSGEAKWDDRLAYENVTDYKIPNDLEGLDTFSIQNGAVSFYKVSDDLPSIDELKKSKIYSVSNDGFVMNMSDGYQSNSTCFYDTNIGFMVVCYSTTITHSGKEYDVPSTGVYISDGSIDMDVYLKVQHVKPIDQKFIPSELNEVILPSSTSGSSKKFKITVDDSGTISATEVK